MEYQRTEKAYEVAHKDKIGEIYHPETEVQRIYAPTAKKAIYKYFQNEYLPDNYRLIDIRARRQKGADRYLFEGEGMVMGEIERRLEYRKWKADMEAMVKNNPNADVLIYSGEHGAYWRSERRGYTDKKNEAGIYKIEDAWRATCHVDLSKRISFILTQAG